MIDLLESEEAWWTNRGAVPNSYKVSSLSPFVYKITDRVRKLCERIAQLEEKGKQMEREKSEISASNEMVSTCKNQIAFVKQSIKNVAKKFGKSKGEVSSNPVFIPNLLKAEFEKKELT